MNLTGARWSLSSADAVLRLRALRSSDDFDAYWKFHEQQEHKRNHASHYADQHVPNVVLPAVHLSQPSRRSTLKIVKQKGGRNRLRTSELALNFITMRESKRAAPKRDSTNIGPLAGVGVPHKSEDRRATSEQPWQDHESCGNSSRNGQPRRGRGARSLGEVVAREGRG